MSESVHYAWADSLLGYNFGHHHPMSPERLRLTVSLSRSMGLLDLPEVRVVAPAPADGLLELAHEPDYIQAVKRCQEAPWRREPQFGLGTSDNPCFPSMHEVSSQIVGGTVEAARAVWRGEVQHGLNIAGGLHHGMARRCSGFCVYNDVAVGIRALLADGAQRVAYVDTDVHHGDGVQSLFWDEPRVLTVSLHESPRTLFPGTGYPSEIGGPNALGYAANVALPAGTGDSGWLRAFHAVLPPLLDAFDPQVLVSQHGCDTHREDPLAHLALSVDGQRAATETLHELAHHHCEGRWVAVGGGGYAITHVVPRSWTHLLGIAAGHPVAGETALPADWQREACQLTGEEAPVSMTDGAAPEFVSWASNYDPDDPLDQAVLATRRAVFPLHGLDPLW